MRIIKQNKKIIITLVLILGLVLAGILLNSKEETYYETDNKVMIYVQGEVNYPGTYILSSSDRVEDALRVAGGVTRLGDDTKINLADKVYDGMKITVSKSTEKNMINLNDCTEDDWEWLKTLYSLTATQIKKIVAYSNEIGFKEKDELVTVLDMKENVYNKIKEYLII